MKERDPSNGCLAVVLVYVCVITFFFRNLISLTRFRNTQEVPPPVRTFLIEDGIPQRELMFDLEDIEYSGYRVGFINADGSGFTMRAFQATILAFGPYDLQRPKTWNKTGTAIVTRFQDTPIVGHPMVIDQNGRAIICWDDIYNSEGRLRLVDDSSVIIRIEDENDVGQIVLLDMNTCEPTRVLYTETEGRTAYEADLNQDGWLWVERYPLLGTRESAVINPAGEEVKVIPDARNPAWSADGQWLAYWTDFGDGIFIEHRSEGEGRRIVEINGYSKPTWSPDGKWLAYTGTGGILKVNIETGEHILIYPGGHTPRWNWGKTTESYND